ncbi:hypothetical protein CBS101457_002355 [Exobasidium rhododendri]|nr:hypothetical protein CBS101457_002355 [Exobasidium rhododendri]
MATDLVRYLSQEVAADGPEGTSWDRLNTFLDISPHTTSITRNQLIDEELRYYVISTLVQLPNLFAGRFVTSSSRRAASKSSNLKRETGRKRRRRGSDSDEEETDQDEQLQGDAGDSELDTTREEPGESSDHVEVLEEDKLLSLKDLMSKYGAGFRVVAKKELIDAVCVGNARGLTPATYNLLLYTMRKREQGASFTELGDTFKQTSSQNFFWAKQLCDQGLAVKFRANNGKVLVSWIVAKRYAHLCKNLSTFLRGDSTHIKEEEEDEDDGEGQIDGGDGQGDGEDAELEEMPKEAVRDLIKKGKKEQQEDDDDNDDDNGNEEKIEEGEEDGGVDDQDDGSLTTLHGLLAFPPLSNANQEAALIADRALMRMRVLKLLLSSKNNATIRADLIIRIGIKEPLFYQRKSFNACLRQMEIEELIERCLLKRPLQHQKDHIEHCWMATAKGIEHHSNLTSGSLQRETKRMRSLYSREIESSKSKLYMEIAFARQLINKVDESGKEGVTIDSLNASLGGNNDRRRELDHMFANLRKPSNPHFDDYAIFSALQQQGRTRSQHFWTRQYRPEKLSPKESRFVDDSRLNSWIDFPGEESFPTHQQWCLGARGQKSIALEERKAGAREDDEEGERAVRGRPRKSDNAEYERRHSQYEAKKKLAAKQREESEGQCRAEGVVDAQEGLNTRSPDDTRDESERGKQSDESSFLSGTTKRGRPRKRFSAYADRQAEQYRQKRQATLDEMKRKRQAEDLPSEEEKEPQSKKRKNGEKQRQKTAVPIRGKPVFGDTNDPSSNTIDKSTASNGRRQVDTKDRGASTPKAKRSTVNMTLILKRAAVEEFYREVQVIESSQFDFEFRKFLKRKMGADASVQDYEMDRKLRHKLYAELRKESFLKVTKVTAPALSKESQKTIFYWSKIEESTLASFCRKVSEGSMASSRRDDTIKGKKHTILDADQVDAPDSFLQRVGTNFNFEAKNLDELLADERNRKEFLNRDLIRGQYSGMLPGVGARLRFLHKTVVDSFVTEDEEMKEEWRAIVPSENAWIVDFNRWVQEAKLGHFLKLVLPPKHDATLQASQDVDLLQLPMRLIDKEIQDALKVDEAGKSVPERLRELLSDLALLDLAESVELDGDDGEYHQSHDPLNLVYRFNTVGRRKIRWEKSLAEQEQAGQAFDFTKPDQAEQFWKSVKEASLSCVLPQEETLSLPPKEAALYENLGNKRGWYHSYHLLKAQQDFLAKTIELGVDVTVNDDESLLLRIGRASLTPTSILRRYYDRRFPARRALLTDTENKRRRREPKVVRALGDATKERTVTVRQVNAVKRKARLALRERLLEFEDTINAYFEEHDMDESTRKVISESLHKTKRGYAKGEIGMSRTKIHQLFDDVIRGHEEGGNYNSIVKGKKSARKGKAQDEARGASDDTRRGREEIRSRKAAVEWTKARDEILRDAVVILRCRDKYRNPRNPRKNWSALRQVLPDSNPSNRLLHFDQLRMAVGEEAYLNQLEVEWEKLWSAHRGTDQLRDDNPNDATEFDLMEHINFLRKHIDKFSVAEKVDKETGDPLPLDCSKMVDIFDYERPPLPVSDPLNVVARYSTADTSSEDKSRTLRAHALTLTSNAMLLSRADESMLVTKKSRRERGIAIGLAKMVLGTKEENYSEMVATQLCLLNAGEEVMDEALRELQEIKVIKKKAKEGRQIPNRNFTFTIEYDAFFNEKLETVPFWEIAEAEAAIMRGEKSREGEAGVEMFRVNGDEEVAACLTLLSRDQVETSIDLSGMERIKMDPLFNAKKIHDDQLEMPVHIHFKGIEKIEAGRMAKWMDLLTASLPERDNVLHWLVQYVRVEASKSNEAKLTESVEKAWHRWISKLQTGKKEEARRLKRVLDSAGPDGLTKQDLFAHAGPFKHLLSLLEGVLNTAPIPLAFHSGYDESRLISAKYVSRWAVNTSSTTTTATSNEQRFIFPHKWYDIHGNFSPAIWRDSMQLLLHAIVTRCGITQAQLLIQFDSVMDRSEVCHLIGVACRSNVIAKVLSRDQAVRGEQAEWSAMQDYDIALVAVQ